MAAQIVDVINDLLALSIKPMEPPPISELTIDIIHAEILPKLPPKTLTRFKTVSKSFNAIISSPEFIRLHLRHSLSSGNRLLVTDGTNRAIDMYDLRSHSSVPFASFGWPVYTIYIVGSCNGLILVTVEPNIGKLFPLVLLNPSTRTYIDFNSLNTDVVEGNVGFGYDDTSDDYKIVIVSDKSNSYSNWRITTVYSVNLKSWKVVDTSITSDFLETPYTWYNGVLINNHFLHWIFVNRSESKRRIGCFDVISEKWREDVRFPDYYYDYSHKGYFLDMGVVEDCLFTSFVNPDDSIFNVWVMKEHNVQESWIKLLSINIGNDPQAGVVPIAKLFDESTVKKVGFFASIEIPGGVIPVACRGPGRNELLLRKRFHSNNLFWYNWETNTIIEPEIPNVYGNQPYLVMESLVSLPNAKPFRDVYKRE